MRWLAEPFLMGTAAQFARLTAWLQAVGYTEPALCAAAGAATIYDLFNDEERAKLAPVDPQSLVTRLFLDSVAVPWTTVRSLLSADEQETLTDLGLLHTALSDSTQCIASVALYPTEGLYIASDRHRDAEITGEADDLPADLVFSALTAETRGFVSLMPRVRCDNYLELCAGTGIAALVAAKTFANHAWATDITPRATRFARFNAALNGLSNVTVLEGDAFDPVCDRVFDVITAHPPYVAASETRLLFRDGGDDGEEVTRRILENLVAHLAPGGQFYCDCAVSDRTNARAEVRVREMLGPDGVEADVVVLQATREPLMVFVGGRLASGRIASPEYPREIAFFSKLQVEAIVFGRVLIQRRTGARKVATRRRLIGDATRASHLQWLLHYLRETADWGPEDNLQLLDLHPRCLPATELRTQSVLRDGTWKSFQQSLSTRSPFPAEGRCPGWFATLLMWCDGQLTARDHLQHLRDIGILPPGATDTEFATLIRELIDGPFVEVEQFPLDRT